MNEAWRIVHRIDVPSPTGMRAYWVGTDDWRTASTDTPANQDVMGAIKRGSAGGYVRSLVSASGGQAGDGLPALIGRVKADYGAFVLCNYGGELDELASLASGGGTVTSWAGPVGAPFPSGYVERYTADISRSYGLDEITVEMRDRCERLDAPIVTATLAGTGGLEGSVAAARKKVLVFGDYLVPMILIDRVHQVYAVHWNATDLATVQGLTEFGRVFEGGVPLQRGLPYVWAEELFGDDNGPAAGTFRIWNGYRGTQINNNVFGSEAEAHAWTKGPLYVRISAPPVGELRFGARGMLQNTAAMAPRPWRFTDLCNRAGMDDVEPATLAQMQGHVEDFTAGNRYIDGEQTYAETMADRCRTLLGVYGFSRLNRFFCLLLRPPDEGGDASTLTLDDEVNIRDVKRITVAGMERPIWQVSVTAGRAYPCQVLDGASPEMRDILSRQGHLVRFTGTSMPVRWRYPHAQVLELEIDGDDFRELADQSAFVSRFGSIFGGEHDFVQCRCLQWDAQTLARECHDKVTFRVRGRMPALGYDVGVDMRIVSMQVDDDAGEITFTLWRPLGTFPGSTWELGGGLIPSGSGEPGGSWGGDRPPRGVGGDELSSRWPSWHLEAFFSSIVLASMEREWSPWGLEAYAEAAGAPSEQGLVVYHGLNAAPSGGVSGDPVTARAAFMARLQEGVEVEDFEDWSDLEFFAAALDVESWPLVVVPGRAIVLNGISATMPNPIVDESTYYLTYGPTADNSTVLQFLPDGSASHFVSATNGSGRYATSGSKYLNNCATLDDDDEDVSGMGYEVVLFTFEFDAPIAYFGAYLTDAGDFAGELTARLTDTESETVDVPISTTTAEGSLLFWGFVDDTKAYTKVQFFCSRPTSVDYWGMDDVTFGPASDLDD